MFTPPVDHKTFRHMHSPAITIPVEDSSLLTCDTVVGRVVSKFWKTTAFILRVKGEYSAFTFRFKKSWQQQKHWEHQISQHYKLLPYSACNTPLPRWSTLLHCQLAFSLSWYCLSLSFLLADHAWWMKSGCSCWTVAKWFCNSFYFMTSSCLVRLTPT